MTSDPWLGSEKSSDDFADISKAGKKMKLAPLSQRSADSNPFADWSAHLFTADRRPYVILTNSVSLYSVLFTAIGITNEKRFIASAADSLREYVAED